ncbi:MAG: hypothetical protein ACOYVJ_00245 [Nitrospirota bacterium]
MTGKLIIIVGFLLSIFSIFSVPLHATDWNFVTTTTKNYYFIDSDSMLTHDSQITFWVIKMEIESAQVKAKKRCTIDCHFEIAVITDDIRYDVNNHLVKITSFYDDMKWYDVRKGTATKAIVNLLCEYGGPRVNVRNYLKKPFQAKDNFMASVINNLNSPKLYFNAQ